MTRSEGRIAWYTVGVLMVAYTLSFIDRTILSLLVQPIQRDLGVSDVEISLLHGLAFAILYTVLGIPIARLADRRSRRVIIAAGIAIWSLMTALCGLARNFAQLFIARIGVGVGEAALSPAAYSMITDLFPKDRLGRALGIYQIGIYLGAGLAFVVGGLVIKFVSAMPPLDLPVLGEVRGWQTVFLAVGLPGLLVALWMLTVPEPARRNAPGDQPGFSVVLGHLRAHMRTYGGHFLGFSLIALVFNGFIAWLPTMFVRRFDMAQSDVGQSLGLILMLFGTLGIVCGGMLADRWTRAGRMDSALRSGLVGAALTIPFAVAVPLMPTPPLALAMLCGFFFFSSFPYSGAATALQMIAPPAMRAQLSAIYLFVLNLIGIGIGPTAVALATERLFGAQSEIHHALALVGGIGAAAGALVLLLTLAPYRATAATLATEGQQGA